jgi:CRP-like cAMP-binding protein
MDDESKYNDILDAIRTNIWYEAQRAGLRIPFPIRTLQLEPPRNDRPGKLELARASLRRQPFLQRLDPAQIDALLAEARLLRFGRRERIIEQGEEGHSMFILVHGEAEVVVSANAVEQVVATLHEGEYCGEMSLLTGERRTATVRAVTDCELLEIHKDVLGPILAQNQPLVEQLSEMLAKRRLENEGVVAQALATDEMKAKEHEYKQGFLQRLYHFFEL